MSSRLQLKACVVLVRPFRFYGNTITAADNELDNLQGLDAAQRADWEQKASRKALAEHDDVVRALISRGVAVVRLDWALESALTEQQRNIPDSIFPNNSFSIHYVESSPVPVVFLWPMSAGRRNEIPTSLLTLFFALQEKGSLMVVDFRSYEANGQALEGTGALVFSPDGRTVYMSSSVRTSEPVLDLACNILGIPKENRFVFTTGGSTGKPIYHTNVMMWTGEGICAVYRSGMRFASAAEAARFDAHLVATYKTILNLSEAEINGFAGNCLEVCTTEGNRLLCMSQAAYKALSEPHKQAIDAMYKAPHSKVVMNIGQIEHLGGGSVRCLLAAPIVARRDADLTPLVSSLQSLSVAKARL